MEEIAKVKEHQKSIGVNATVAGIVGVCTFDEETLLYYPVPKDYFCIVIEQYAPGVKFTSDLTVTVKAGTKTGVRSATATEGSIYYIEKIVIGTIPNVTGKYSIKIGDVTVISNATLASGTIDLIEIFGNRIRSNKIEISVVLDAEVTSDTDIPFTATIIQKPVPF